MSRAGVGRRNRHSQESQHASQIQTQESQRPTQIQSARRRSEREQPPEEEEEDELDEGQNDNDGDDDLVRKANELVRLALFNESRRVPLRRDEINKRVLGESTRQFNRVLSMAQEQLRSVFGMELVELMSRAERERERNTNDGIQGKANATGLKKKTTTSGSKTYILHSALAPELLDAAAITDEAILDAEYPPADDDADDDDVPQSYGSILSWSTADQLGSLGLLYVILSLILVNGQTMSDPELKKYLKSLRLPLSATIEFAPHATQKSTTVEAYLSQLVKQGYLDKIKVGSGSAPAPTQGKRGRGRAPGVDDNDSGNVYEWRWGARAYAEVGEQPLARFVAEFMVERSFSGNGGADDSDEEEGNATQRRQAPTAKEKERMLEKMMTDISRAAGGKFNDIH